MSDTFKEYINKLYSQGILIVGASGNDGQNVAKWPGTLPSVVSVAAIDQYGSRWENSNWGEWVEICGPGKMILSTSVNSNGQYVYSYYSGTSMATPHYSGVAALLWSHHPQCTNYQIRYAIAATAKPMNGGSGCDDKLGHGLVQALDALNFLNENPCTQSRWGQEASKGGCFVGFTQQSGEEYLDTTNSYGESENSENANISVGDRRRERKERRQERRQKIRWQKAQQTQPLTTAAAALSAFGNRGSSSSTTTTNNDLFMNHSK